MNRRGWCSGLLAGILFGIAALVTSGTAVATPVATNTIRVSPALTNIQLSPGETSTTVMATVRNMTASQVVVRLSARDFTGQANYPGAISFYGAGYNPTSNPHSLQNVVSFQSPIIVLAPHASQQVPIILSGLSQLAPGGHYGAALFNPETTSETNGTSRVSINSSVASLIFLTTATGGSQNVSLRPFSFGSLFFGLPSNVNLVFQNNGNTQAAPEGQLTLYGPDGSITSTVVLNAGSGLILPGMSRLFQVILPLHDAGLAAPGRYRLELRYRPTPQSGFVTVNKSFYLINLSVIIPALLLIALLAWVCRWYLGDIIRIVRLIAMRIIRLFRKRPPPTPPEKPKKSKLVQG